MITNGTYQSPLLASFSGFSHGFSTRIHGDMRIPANRERFVLRLGLDANRLIKPRQIHGKTIVAVDTRDVGTIIPDADGLVTRDTIPIGVITADCVPLLAVDPDHGITGVAHAGWKGTLADIPVHLIANMIRIGADASKIRIVIGPCIGMSCYNVPSERADLFRTKYGSRSGIVRKIEHQLHIDIGQANRLALLSAGIPGKHIDTLEVCTSCNPGSFFSYRKDTDNSYGEMIGIIGAMKGHTTV